MNGGGSITNGRKNTVNEGRNFENRGGKTVVRGKGPVNGGDKPNRCDE